MSGRNDKLYFKALGESFSDAPAEYTGSENSVTDDKSSWQVFAGGTTILFGTYSHVLRARRWLRVYDVRYKFRRTLVMADFFASFERS